MKNLINIMLFVIVGVGFSGCAVSTPTYTAEGKIGFSINCSGAALNWGYCEQKAGEMCGANGYDILSKNGENIGNITSFNSSSSVASRLNRYGYQTSANYNESAQANMFSVPVVNRTMLIACKK